MAEKAYCAILCGLGGELDRIETDHKADMTSKIESWLENISDGDTITFNLAEHVNN